MLAPAVLGTLCKFVGHRYPCTKCSVSFNDECVTRIKCDGLCSRNLSDKRNDLHVFLSAFWHSYNVVILWLNVRRIPMVEIYSNKLMWLSEKNVLSVLDTTGCSVGRMRLSTSSTEADVTAFTLFHSAKFQYPGTAR